jgi:hypothetical protein
MRTVIIAEGYHCVGTCVTSFDDAGRCIVPELPWATEEDFQYADQQAEHITENEFYANVPPDEHIEQEIDGHECEFLEADGVYIIYDQDTNRHYFFAD